MPVCKRDREVASLQALAGAEVSLRGVDSVPGVAAGEGRGVEEGASTSVAVGEGTAVTEEDSMVWVGAEIGGGIAVSDGDVDEEVIVAVAAPSVTVTLGGMICVEGTSVDAGNTG
jgi:hypothetical protein